MAPNERVVFVQQWPQLFLRPAGGWWWWWGAVMWATRARVTSDCVGKWS